MNIEIASWDSSFSSVSKRNWAKKYFFQLCSTIAQKNRIKLMNILYDLSGYISQKSGSTRTSPGDALAVSNISTCLRRWCEGLQIAPQGLPTKLHRTPSIIEIIIIHWILPKMSFAEIVQDSWKIHWNSENSSEVMTLSFWVYIITEEKSNGWKTILHKGTSA